MNIIFSIIAWGIIIVLIGAMFGAFDGLGGNKGNL